MKTINKKYIYYITSNSIQIFNLLLNICIFIYVARLLNIAIKNLSTILEDGKLSDAFFTSLMVFWILCFYLSILSILSFYKLNRIENNRNYFNYSTGLISAVKWRYLKGTSNPICDILYTKISIKYSIYSIISLVLLVDNWHHYWVIVILMFIQMKKIFKESKEYLEHSFLNEELKTKIEITIDSITINKISKNDRIFLTNNIQENYFNFIANNEIIATIQSNALQSIEIDNFSKWNINIININQNKIAIEIIHPNSQYSER